MPRIKGYKMVIGESVPAFNDCLHFYYRLSTHHFYLFKGSKAYGNGSKKVLQVEVSDTTMLNRAIKAGTKKISNKQDDFY